VHSVLTQNAPAPAGHYSQAIVHNGLIYVSGQLPIDPATGERKIGSIEEQTEQAIANLEQILAAAGSELSQVLKTTVYISDIALWDRVNAVYADVFGEHRPARAIVPTKDLHYGLQIEIDAVAVQIRDTNR
jgi:2-iminobutanoate/2-iminopropanoate deaminase